MKSFEDALNKHKNNLSADLIGFDEGKRVRRIMMDIDSNSSDYEYYFQAGAQSRQSEVDELKKRLLVIEEWISENRFEPTETWLTCDVVDVDELIKIIKGENHE